jgi:hypothetical protein
MEASWSSGIARDLDDPQAGTATFKLKNTGRRFEPEYAAGAYYPNIVPMRRFRWSITADGVSYPQGIWYAQSWQVTYPAGTTYSEVVVSCVDGFGILSLYNLPRLDTSDAETYGDVVDSDQPYAHWPLDEGSGRKMTASVGPEGVYRKSVDQGADSPVVGESGYGIRVGLDGYGKAVLDDAAVFHDAGAVSAEVVINQTANPSANRYYIGGPFDTAASQYSFLLYSDGSGHVAAAVADSGGTSVSVINPAATANGVHHLAFTFDGGFLTLYVDGVAVAQKQGIDNVINPDVGESVYLGNLASASVSFEPVPVVMGHAAVYLYALSPARVAAHATAALSRGYAQQTAGSRIASQATHPLWSVAGIPAGQVTVQPEMQHGQATLDAILETVKAETPIGLFYFDDSGNPDYQPWDYPTTLQATFGESEVQYDDIGLQYDDEVYNQSTVSRDGGEAQTASDATSQGQYSVRAHDETSLIIQYDSDAELISQAIVDRFKDPMYRIETIALNGAAPNRRVQILGREIGDTIRVKRRGEGGIANPDIITRILGKQKTLDVNGDLRCTWNLARGFPAQDAHWRLGQDGYTELGTNTVLG